MKQLTKTRLTGATMVALFALLGSSELSAQVIPAGSPSSVRSFTIVADLANSTENTGVAAKLDWSFYSASNQVIIKVTNLSGTLSYTDGVLGGFGFDTPFAIGTYSVSDITSGSLTTLSNLTAFSYVTTNDGPNGGPGVSFDLWAGDTNGNSPGTGITSGNFATLLFSFDNSLSATYFDKAYWFANNGTDPDMGLRFRSVDPAPGSSKERSEKIWYTATGNGDPETPPITSVPEPGTYGLAAFFALGSLIGLRRLRVLKKL